jgi:hypothetical protein
LMSAFLQQGRQAWARQTCHHVKASEELPSSINPQDVHFLHQRVFNPQGFPHTRCSSKPYVVENPELLVVIVTIRTCREDEDCGDFRLSEANPPFPWNNLKPNPSQSPDWIAPDHPWLSQ